MDKINHGNIWLSAVFLQVYHNAMVLLLFCDNSTNVMSERFLENLFIFVQQKYKIMLISAYLLMHSLDYDIFILRDFF